MHKGRLKIANDIYTYMRNCPDCELPTIAAALEAKSGVSMIGIGVKHCHLDLAHFTMAHNCIAFHQGITPNPSIILTHKHQALRIQHKHTLYVSVFRRYSGGWASCRTQISLDCYQVKSRSGAHLTSKPFSLLCLGIYNEGALLLQIIDSSLMPWKGPTKDMASYNPPRKFLFKREIWLFGSMFLFFFFLIFQLNHTRFLWTY